MPKNYSKFSPNLDKGPYDHIIIGSGIGSLTLATMLARCGRKVAIFERHYVPGGFTHAFKRKNGFQWDVGVHYMGNMTKKDGLRKIMDFLTNHRLEWEPMGDIYDVVYIEGDKYEFPAGKENFRTQMKGYFPDDSEAIDQYLDLIDRTNRKGSAFFMEKSFEPWLSWLLGGLIRKPYQKISNRTTFEVLNDITSNPRLIAVLCGQCGNYGLPPRESSFAAHAMVIGHFMEGGFYPHGGSPKIAERTLETLEKLGADIFVSSEVSEIVVEKNRVLGIKVKEHFIPCKSVISNIGVNNTFNYLLSEPQRKKCGFDLQSVEPSSAHLCLYVGLNKGDHELQLPKHNIWCYANEHISSNLTDITAESAASKFSYISFPSAKDPEWRKENPDKATIQAITAARYDWFKDYEEQPWLKREEAYLQIKKSFENSMLDRLYELVPQIKGHVQYTEVSSPLSTRHFTNYKNGEIYGLAHSPERFNLSFLRPYTKIKGLKLVGQDITLVGVGGAMLSGMLCAITILKFRIWKVFKAFNEPLP
ncbi:phytoene desaturase family protein [Reichenbachiella ulvae]|uniref:NAD(P)/FAD-dependent oxidoreductase n=1 Tax=Reichenbachiella ulvae TaxID=2980104 RepID=A0ABT3CRU6_9BACT|nr:NAD(P)/FAD-dependent oxidoreductase [Reichenbachiella ulvae]MCV9386342.1 NAD(P)/FAD-dependent oxidoreductase [Reichenbachiella ulvae]